MSFPSLALRNTTARKTAPTSAPAGHAPAGVGARARPPSDERSKLVTVPYVAKVVDPWFPFQRRLREVARGAGVRDHRITKDERTFFRSGDVHFELEAEPADQKVFDRLWQQMLEGVWGNAI